MQNLLSICLEGYKAMTPHVPEFNPPVTDAVYEASGEAILEAFQMLELMARSNDLPSLLSFCDNRPVPRGLRFWLKKLAKNPASVVRTELAAAIEKTHGLWDEWFSIEAGLRSVEGLLAILEREGWRSTEALIRDNFGRQVKGPIAPVPASKVVTELNALAACLRVGATHGARFRLAHRSA